MKRLHSKRILGLILVFSLVLQTAMLPTFVSAEGSELPTNETEAEILVNLGIATSFDMNTYDPYSYISNSEFLSMLSLLTSDEAVTDYDAYAKQLGAIGADEKLQKSLYPTYGFAYLAALGALGYNKLGVIPSEGKEDWALIQAKKIGIYSRSNPDEKSLRRADAVKLITNLFDEPVLDLSTVTIDHDGFVVRPLYKENKDGALYYYRGITKREGLVDATEYTAMYGESSLGEDRISIDGTEYLTEKGKDFDKLVGVYADVYFSEDGTVLSVTKDNDVKSVTFTAEDFVSYEKSGSTKNITYSPEDKNGKTYKAELEAAAAVIINGYGMSSYSKSDFEILKGTFTLYDNDRNSKYDTVVIEAAKTVFIDEINTADGVIYNKFSFDSDAEKIDVDTKEGNVKLTVTKNGEAISLSDLLTSEVVDIYFNTEAIGKKRIVKIVSGGSVEDITVKSISSDNKTLKDANHSYDISKWYRKALAASVKQTYAPVIKVGETYTFYFDPDGKIAAAETSKYEGMTCGYLQKAVNRNKGLNDNFLVRMFMQSGKWEEYRFAEKVKLNGASKKTKDCFNDVIGKEGELILIKTNTDGEISEVKTAIDTFTLGTQSENFNISKIDPSVGKAKYWNVSNYFEDMTNREIICWFNAKTRIFGVATGAGATDNDYSILSSEPFTNDESYKITAYGLDEFGICDYMVVESDSEMRKKSIQSGTTMLISEAYETTNADGEIVQCVVGPYEFLSKYTLTLSSEATEYDNENNQLATHTPIQQGDLIRFTKNDAGEINTYAIICRISDAEAGNGYYPSSSSSGLHQVTGYMMGKCVMSRPDVGAFMLDCRSTDSDPEQLRTGVTNTSKISLKVFICEGNGREKQIRRGSLNDMSRGDFVFALTNWALVHTIVIYR